MTTTQFVMTIGVMTKNGVDGDIIGVVVIRIQGKYAAGQGVHHVGTGGFHDNIPHKCGGKGAVSRQNLGEAVQLLLVGKFAEKQQVSGFLKPKPFFFDKPADDILNVHAAVIHAVHYFHGTDFGNFRQPGQYAFAVDIAQAALYVIFFIQFRVHRTIFTAQLG